MALMLLVATRIYAITLNPEPETKINGVKLNSAEEHELEGPEGNFWVNLTVVFICTVGAGTMSGLTIGLAAVDRLSLEVNAIGNPQIKKATERIFPVIDQHHWMLVTLLLCNAGAMETMPIFLDRMVNPFLAIIISVTLILIFGEVIP